MRMQFIDHERVQPRSTMLFSKVRMVLGQIVVTMEHNLRILLWPGDPAGHGTDQREACKDCEGGGLP